MKRYSVNSPNLCMAITSASKLHFTSEISIESQLTDLLRTSYCIFEKVLMDNITEPHLLKIILMIELSFPEKVRYIPVCIELQDSCYPRKCPRIYIPPTYGFSIDPYCTYINSNGEFNLSSDLQWGPRSTLVSVVKYIHYQFDTSLPVQLKYNLFFNEAYMLKHLPLFQNYELIPWSEIKSVTPLRDVKKDALYKGYIYDSIPVLLREYSLAVKFHDDMNSFYKFLKMMDHPNMGEIYGYSVHDKNKFCILMEYSETNLSILLHQQTLSLVDKQDIALDLCRYLRWTHYYSSEPILHRDFNMSNVYLSESGIAKIYFPVPKTFIQLKQTMTYSYQIPSFPNSIFSIPSSLSNQYSSFHEVQLFGNLLYELFTLETIYDAVKKQLKNVTVDSLFQSVPSCVKKTILDCWAQDPSMDLFLLYNQIRDWSLDES